MKNTGQTIVNLMSALSSTDEKRKAVLVHGDGIHDDTAAIQLICDGKAVGVLPNGKPLSEYGGMIKITGEIFIS